MSELFANTPLFSWSSSTSSDVSPCSFIDLERSKYFFTILPLNIPWLRLLRFFKVDHPPDAVFVDKVAMPGPPKLFLKGHAHLAASR